MAEAEEQKKKERKKEIKEYDFKNVERTDKRELEPLKFVGDVFAKKIASRLTEQFRVTVTAEVTKLTEEVYAEVIKRIELPVVLAVINIEPLRGEIFIEFNSNIVFTFIDRSLGGRGEGVIANRELTEIEIGIIEKLIRMILEDWKTAWAIFVEIIPKFVRMERNPQFVQIASLMDIVIITTIEVKIGDVKGAMTVCIPSTLLDPISDKLSIVKTSVQLVQKGSEEDRKRIRDRINEVLILPIAVELGYAELKVDDLLGLEPGDVIRLKTKATDTVVVKVGEIPKFIGYPGLVDGRVGVQVRKKL